MRYLTVDELIYINEQIPTIGTIHKILKGKQRVRDMGLLEAAAARPMQTVFGEDAYPTTQEKAAALLHSLTRNHPFADGNKRTATVAAIFMLDINGLRVKWKAEEALTQFAEWLPTEPGQAAPEPEAEADMQAIAVIMHDHQWLLDELAGR
jgi:death on curing protein